MPSDYQRVASAIRYLSERWQEPPTLDAVAAHVGLSAFHFQRLFRRMTGISPKRYSQALAGDVLEQRLEAGDSLLEASSAVGQSSSSRGHDLLVSLRAMTPGEFKGGGAGLTLDYGVHETPLGPCLVVTTSRGICELTFLEGDVDVAALRARWPHAKLRASQKETKAIAESLLMAGSKPGPVSLHVKGTNFQLRVWKALLALEPGTTTSYQGMAKAIGAPKAARAVGQAVGRNPVAVFIPCHRVLRANGALGNYRWGIGRKRSLLALEAARYSSSRST
ncbi:MAG: methylated-DNA--[protein]-cysteine S-methyltransferase [Myxococcota bacterium]